MHIVVLILGLIALAAGAGAFGFGLLIKEFSFGGTLLIAGTTTFVGGLVMIAIAGAIRELHRIAQALTSRPAPMPMPRFPRPGEPLDPYAPGAFRGGLRVPPVPMPSPPSTGPAALPQQRPRDPRLELATPAEPVPELSEPTAPTLQPQVQTAVELAAEFNEPESVPLSPQEQPVVPAFHAPDQGHDAPGEPSAEPEAEARAYEPEPEAMGLEPEPEARTSESEADATGSTREDRVEMAAVEEPAWEPQSDLPRPSPFDAIWPPRGRAAARRMHAEADEAERADGGMSGIAEPMTVSPSAVPSAEPEMSPERDEAPVVPAAADDAATEPAHEAPHAVSILKSGVVDGMAYTLYSDGSIEAELATGTIRFASINELRMHLEKTV